MLTGVSSAAYEYWEVQLLQCDHAVPAARNVLGRIVFKVSLCC